MPAQAAPAWPQAPTVPTVPMLPLVLDTNIALDLFVFADPATAPLRAAVDGTPRRWLATPAMREELARVLAYPHIVKRLTAQALAAGAVLQAFDQRVCTVPAAAKAPCTCKDPDDQKFIDLAVAHRATLLSKDTHVLSMAKRLATLGVRVCRRWEPTAAATAVSAPPSVRQQVPAAPVFTPLASTPTQTSP